MRKNTDQNPNSFYIVKVELNICEPFRTYRKYIDQISKKRNIFTKYNSQRWEKIITYQKVVCTTVIVCQNGPTRDTKNRNFEIKASPLLTLFTIGFFGAAHGWGGGCKKAPSSTPSPPAP